MSRIPSHVRLLKDRWSYRLEISTETLKAFNGRLDESVLRVAAPLSRAKHVGVDTVTGLPAYMAP